MVTAPELRHLPPSTRELFLSCAGLPTFNKSARILSSLLRWWGDQHAPRASALPACRSPHPTVSLNQYYCFPHSSSRQDAVPNCRLKADTCDGAGSGRGKKGKYVLICCFICISTSAVNLVQNFDKCCKTRRTKLHCGTKKLSNFERSFFFRLPFSL